MVVACVRLPCLAFVLPIGFEIVMFGASFLIGSLAENTSQQLYTTVYVRYKKVVTLRWLMQNIGQLNLCDCAQRRAGR